MASEAQVDANDQPQDERQRSATPTPWWLRPARAVSGVGLLAASWGAIMLALWLAIRTLGVPPHRQVIVRIVLYVVGTLGACWLGLAALAALLGGAFCLMLAVTNRDW
jgi:hypothetical protein